jgi:hypothetical protein
LLLLFGKWHYIFECVRVSVCCETIVTPPCRRLVHAIFYPFIYYQPIHIIASS